MLDKKFGRVLVVDDDEDVLQAARLLLKQHLERVDTERDPGKIPAWLKNTAYDVIMLDMNFTRDLTGGQEGFMWLKQVLEIDPDVVVILITAFGDVEMAVRAIKEGATDFILKPWQNEKLLATLSAALDLRRSRLEIAGLKSRQKELLAGLNQPFPEFIAFSPAIRAVMAAIEKVAGTEANVLILGENGTGKELVARALHRHSRRADEAFIGVDMGAISETLFESELFGHKKGAFTDAQADRLGRFEQASGGTLFFDEIGNLPLALQAKILRVLETREVVPLGENRARQIDIRLVCASNMPIHHMVENKAFRQDLLYRINTVEIHVPPLRERPEDIPGLLDHFLEVYRHKYHRGKKEIGEAARAKLLEYHWPGNVRELDHAVERAVILADAPVLRAEDFFLPMSREMGSIAEVGSSNLGEIEKMAIRRILQACGGNISQAAKELGLTRASLYRRLEKFGI